MHDTETRLRVSRLFVYPLKSAAGVELDAAHLDGFGVRLDRRWMVVDGDGALVSQRERPRLALIRVGIEGGRVTATAEGGSTLQLPRPAADGPAPLVSVDLWGREARGVDCGEAAATWLSDHLGAAARLLYMPPELARQVTPEYAVGGERVAFSDGYPIHLVSEASLVELNRRLEVPVDVRRFRPNLVVAGTGPHGEDGWRRIRIGGVVFHVVKPCPRCAVTTTDQDTAERYKEPLRTLARYRRWEGYTWFGQNLIHEAPGVIEAGAPVEVLERRAQPDPPLTPAGAPDKGGAPR